MEAYRRLQVGNAVIATGDNSGVRGLRTVAAELANAAASLSDFDHRNPEIASTVHQLAYELAAMIGHRPTAKLQHVAGVQHWIDEVATAAAFYTGSPRQHRYRSLRPAAALSAAIDGVLAALSAPTQSTLQRGGNRVASRRSLSNDVVRPDWNPSAGDPSPFNNVVRTTPCLFARQSRIWRSPQLNEIESPTAQRAIRCTLRGFTHACRPERLDGYLLTLPAEYGITVGRLAETTRSVVDLLAASPCARWRPYRSPRHPGWHLRFARQRYFVLTMGPCYPREHSRHSFGAAATFILLQPEAAFDRVVRPQDSGRIAPAVRSTIRQQYHANGQAYDIAITESPVEAERFVKPLVIGDDPVHWWES
jgi:hypothetical protein